MIASPPFRAVPAGGCSVARDLAAASVAEVFQARAASDPSGIALTAHDGSVELTWSAYAGRVRAIAAGLASIGVGHGDTVALAMASRPELDLVDTATFHLGAVPFAVPSGSRAGRVAALLRSAAADVVVTEVALLPVVGPAAAAARCAHVIVVDDDSGAHTTLAVLERRGAANADFDFHLTWRALAPEDVVALISPSGRWSAPLPITHADVLGAIDVFGERLALPGCGRVVAWTPTGDVAERTVAHYLPMALGYSTTTCTEMRELVACLSAVRPTLFVARARFWEHLRTAVEAHAECPLGDDDVAANLRERIGLTACVSANASGSPPADVIEFFTARGIPLRELAGTLGTPVRRPAGRPLDDLAAAI